MSQEKITIRDLRKKEKFIIDDEYLNGYAKICGIYATGAYISLCRHADKNQKAFPSIQRIADELAVSDSSIKRGLNKLEKHGIILRERKGKMLTNRYYLLDKSEWSKEPIKKSDSSVRPIREFTKTHHTVPADLSIERKHNRKETQKKGMSPKATGWQLEEEIEKLITDSRRHIQIIGLWIKERDLRPGNTEQMESLIKRNLRPARILNGFDDEEIKETIQVVKNTDYLHKFTLETIAKYIDEVVANRKKRGPRIIRYEEIRNPDGTIVVRPIYENKKVE